MPVIEIDDGEAWNELVLASPRPHLLQSYEWGELKAEFGWKPVRLALEEGGDPRAGAQLLLRRLPGGGFAYVPRGPCLAPQEEGALAELLPALQERARGEGAIFTRLEPDWEKQEAAFPLGDYGFAPVRDCIQPRSSIHIDLTRSLEEILAGMKPKTRYNVRLAARKGVVCIRGGVEDIPSFYRCLETTGKRDGFPIHTLEYYQRAWQLFAPQGGAILLLARYQGQLLAGLVAFAFGGWAYYLYGASSDRHRNLMPDHLLQWEAMKWAKEQDCRTYDLWGVPAEAGKEETGDVAERGGLWGVYRFKRGFGGRLVRYAGAYDSVHSPLRYWLATRGWTVAKRAIGAGQSFLGV